MHIDKPHPPRPGEPVVAKRYYTPIPDAAVIAAEEEDATPPPRRRRKTEETE